MREGWGRSGAAEGQGRSSQRLARRSGRCSIISITALHERCTARLGGKHGVSGRTRVCVCLCVWVYVYIRVCAHAMQVPKSTPERSSLWWPRVDVVHLPASCREPRRIGGVMDVQSIFHGLLVWRVPWRGAPLLNSASAPEAGVAGGSDGENQAGLWHGGGCWREAGGAVGPCVVGEGVVLGERRTTVGLIVFSGYWQPLCWKLSMRSARKRRGGTCETAAL